jgi:TrpR-related protein YerC/YecD
MLDKQTEQKEQTRALFDAVLALETVEEVSAFFEDLCTMKELLDMGLRLEVAKMLINGATYENIVKEAKLSTTTISRINRCVQYGSGGYKNAIEKTKNTI